MKQLRFYWILLGSVVWSRAAQAQYHSYSHCCHCCCPDTTTTTERNNRTAILVAPVLAYDSNGTPYGGGYAEAGYALRPRLTVGGYLLATGHTASPSNYGYEATAPATGLYAVAGRLRYQLLNNRRWRFETLASLGLGGVELVDRDQQVYYQNSNSSRTHAATVAFRVHPLAEVGLGATYKLTRECWLTSSVSYANLALSSGLGEPGEFSYWQASVGVAVPWGWRK